MIRRPPRSTLFPYTTLFQSYDSSLMADDFRAYRPRIGDRVSQQEPLVRGREAALWEIPMSFELDDWPHFQFNFTPSRVRSEEHTSEFQSRQYLVCRLLLVKK